MLLNAGLELKRFLVKDKMSAVEFGIEIESL